MPENRLLQTVENVDDDEIIDMDDKTNQSSKDKRVRLSFPFGCW